MVTTPFTQCNVSRPRRRSASFGEIARRVSSRTTDLLAISLVLVASLTLGRQVLQWWRAEPPQVVAPAQTGAIGPDWENTLEHLALEFGDLPVGITRQVVRGDKAEAIAAAVRHCQRIAERADHPWRDRDEAEELLGHAWRLSGDDPDTSVAAVVAQRLALHAVGRLRGDEVVRWSTRVRANLARGTGRCSV